MAQIKLSIRTLVGSLFFISLTSLPLYAATLDVPADYPTLVDAVAASSSGDIITVSTSAEQEPITITHSLTIVGNPVLKMRVTDFSCFPSTSHIELNGPGTGKVIISGLQTEWWVDCYMPAPAIQGGGFSRLAIYESTIKAAPSGLTGVGDAAPAVQTTVPEIVVAESTITGGGPDADSCYGSLPSAAYPAVDAPGATVTVLDSVLNGGSGGFNCCQWCDCPGSLSGKGGEGAVAIVANKLFAASSIFNGGTGSDFVAWDGDVFFSTPTVCGTQPSGGPYQVNFFKDLGSDVSMSGSGSIGTPLTITYPPFSTIAAFGIKYFSPFEIPGYGYTFLDPIKLHQLGSYTFGASSSAPINIPNNPALIGQEIVIQPYQLGVGLLRPVAKVLKP